MSNKLARPLDPEFQRAYDEAAGNVSEPIAYDAEVVEAPEGEDDFQAFARLAKEHQADTQLRQRPKADIGSFDHFEQGVSDMISLGWKWLTR